MLENEAERETVLNWHAPDCKPPRDIEISVHWGNVCGDFILKCLGCNTVVTPHFGFKAEDNYSYEDALRQHLLDPLRAVEKVRRGIKAFTVIEG